MNGQSRGDLEIRVGSGGAGASGYAHPSYAESLAKFGRPMLLKHSRASILARDIPGSPYLDAIGPYPLLSCSNWQGLRADLEELEGELVSIAAVVTPFTRLSPGELKLCFSDRLVPFKEHFVVDLSRPELPPVHAHHRRNARRALREVVVERAADPATMLDDWYGLYANLVRRHEIKGIASFSRDSFARQLQVPGIVAFRALNGEDVVGASLWYVEDYVAYYHLAAYSDRGYELRASFAIFTTVIEHFFSRGLRWLSLGAGAGVTADTTDGLSRFKRGWATGTRTAYFCGRILSPDRYAELLDRSPPGESTFFPAYRSGEHA